MNTKYFPLFSNNLLKFFLIISACILAATITIPITLSPLPGIIFTSIVLTLIIFSIKVEYSIYLFFLLLIPKYSINISGFDARLFDINDLSLIILTISFFISVLLKIHKKNDQKYSNFIFCLFIFYAWVLISIFWSEYNFKGFLLAFHLALHLSVIYILYKMHIDKNFLLKIFKVIIAVGLISALLMLMYPYFDYILYHKIYLNDNLNILIQTWYNPKGGGRAGRTLSFFLPHYDSAYLLLPIVSSVAMVLVSQKKNIRILFIFFALFMFCAMISSLSKTPFISIVLGSIFFMYYIKPLRKNILKYIAFFLAIIFILFCIARLHNIAGSFSNYFVEVGLKEAPPEKETSIGNRLGIFLEGVNVLTETGGFGCGAGSFRPIIKSKGYTVDCTHQQVLFELGIIGLMLWMWILISFFLIIINTLKNIENEYYRRVMFCYISGYISLIIMWFFSASYSDTYLWAYIAIGFPIIFLSREDTQTGSNLPYSKDNTSLVLL